MAAVTRTIMKRSFVRPTFWAATLAAVASISGCSAEPAHSSEAPTTHSRLQHVDGESAPDASVELPSDETGGDPAADPEHPAVDPSDAVTDPEDPTADAEDPTADAEDPSADAKDPTADAEDPTADAKDPSEPSEPTADRDPSEPTANEDPSDSSADPSDPSAAPTGATADSSDPSDPSAAPTGATADSSNPADPSDPTDPSADPTGATADSSDPLNSPLDPTDSGEPSVDGVDPVERTTASASCNASVDWSTAKVLSQATGQRVQTLRVVQDDANVYICVEGDLPVGQHYQLFFDSDGNPATGESQGGWAPNGAEVRVEDGKLFKFTGSAWSAVDTATIEVARDAQALSLVVSKGDASLVPYFALGFRQFFDGWNAAPLERLPTSGHHFARLSLPPSATVAGGLIIPIYTLPAAAAPGATSAQATAGTVWEKLAQGAASMRAAKASGSFYSDFVVAVSGPLHRPFQTRAEFDNAALSYDPIVAQGGQIFGYVHTLTDPDGPTFRPVADVLQDVDAWIQGYPALAGIWIDEYYPKYEYTVGDQLNATFPNGSDNASADANMSVASGKDLTTSQMRPDGGYYKRLTDAIRQRTSQSGQTLKLLGNAGGPVRSNQLLYSALPDILCGFEQTVSEASANDWARLTLPSLLPDKPSLLALVHTLPETEACASGGACPTLEAALDRAIGHGYSYFYATDEVYKLPDGTRGALWQRLPPYFNRQIELLTQRAKPTD